MEKKAKWIPLLIETTSISAAYDKQLAIEMLEMCGE
jgi:hypothetical protein